MNGQIREVAKKLTHSNRLKKLAVGLVAIVVMLGLILPTVEEAFAGSKINNYFEGIYFAVTTVTGVGYGDLVPISTAGRIIAMALQTMGVILFGSITAIVAVELLRYQEDYYVRRMFKRMDELEIKVDEIKKHLDYLVKIKSK